MVVIKLGGGVIAPKSWEMGTVDLPILKRLCREIKDGLGSRGLLMVSGSGNFGHVAVKKYGIDTPLGVARVQRMAQKIGEMVTECLLDEGMAASLVSPHDIWPGGSFKTFEGIVPVFYGDVVWEGGEAVIYSGETIIKKLMSSLRRLERIIQVSCEDGVWDEKKKVIPRINLGNWGRIKKIVGGSAGVDYTGGMLHKVEESLEIARKYGVKTVIINGKKIGRLERVLEGKDVLGTLVG